MTMQYFVAVRNAQADAFESTVGTAPLLKIYSGTKPANCAASASGTVLASMTLPSDWLTAASAGEKHLVGTWLDSSADATGTAGHFRIWDAAGTTCHQQGSITVTAGGGDMTLDNISIGSTQPVQITAYSITRGNA